MKGPSRNIPLSKRRLRNWIQIIGVTRMAENHLREYLRVNHATTLPRFDVMAALWRKPKGVTMTELSRMLLVSNGNASTVVDRLVKEGLAKRMPSETDRRTIYVALTQKGTVQFDIMASGHETEVDRLFSNLTADDLDSLSEILARARQKTPDMGAAA